MSPSAAPLLAAGLSFGAALGSLLLVRAWLGRNRLAGAAAALILAAAAAGGLIVWSWQSPSPASGPSDVASLAEAGLTLAVGPLILMLAGALLGTAMRPWVPFAPALGAFVAIALADRAYGGDPVAYAVPVFTCYTLSAWLLATRKREPTSSAGRRARQRRRAAFALLGAVSLANSASLARLIWPQVDALRPLVPWTISLMLTALVAAILWTFLARNAALLAEPVHGSSDSARLVARAEDLIVREQLYCDPQIKGTAIADRLGVPPSELSKALAAGDDGSFAALVQRVRLAAAAQMLGNPAERATSIEAVGLLCGFGSRSAFYEAFQRQFGRTPGAWRSDSLSGR